MKNLLALVGAAVVLVAGLGWYLGWYKVGVSNGTGDVQFDLKKVEADLKKEKETVGKIIKEHETGKGVPGQSTSLPVLPGGSFELPPLPPLPPLPTPPASGIDPSSLPPLPPPPPFVPGKQ
jgi:hypothetical protein